MGFGHDRAFARRELAEQCRETLRQRAGLAVTDLPAVDHRDRRQFTHRAGAEHLVGAVRLGQRQVDFLVRDGVRQSSSTVERVIPSGQATSRGVRNKPRSTMNTCVAFVSAMKPR